MSKNRCIVSFFWALIVLLPIQTAFGQNVMSTGGGLLVRSTAPSSDNGTPFPHDAGFFMIDQNILKAAARFEPTISRLTNFPLGSRLVDLSVTQFDVLTRNAKVLARTAAGDVPVNIPSYVLLHGQVDNSPGSHVYIAVFPTYALGYITIPNVDGTVSRYLIQPVTQSVIEGKNTMICYAESAIDRTAETASKWVCGTEEYPGNFKTLHSLEAAVSNESASKFSPMTQSKVVRVMQVDMDCDYDYFLDFKNRYPAASSDSAASYGMQYAIANLGASSDIYVRDLNGALVSSFLHIWTVDDPYPGTTTSELLPQWESSNGLPDDNRAGAILLSGINSIGGLAQLQQLCSTTLGYCVCGTDNVYSYPKDGFIWDVDVVSHEFGHIVGALHTHNCSWNPAIDSCVAAEGGCYSTPVPTLGTIMSYCHLTPKGVELKFHKRQIPDMQQWIQEAACATPEQLPVADAGPDLFMCGSDSVTINGTGTMGLPPYSYSWRALPNSPVSTNPTFTVKPSKTTKYVLTLTDVNNLRTYDTMTVNVDAIKANPGIGAVICGVGTMTLSGSATNGVGVLPSSYTYEWRDQASGALLSTKQTFDANVTQTTTYTLKVTDSIGCSNTMPVTVTVTQKPLANMTPTGTANLCQGDTVILQADANFKHYIWYKDGIKLVDTSVQTFAVTKPGTYTVVVTNPGLGCWDSSAALVVTQLPLPGVPTISKSNNTLTCSSDPSYTAYQWYKNLKPISGANASSFTVTNVGAYFVRVTGTNGCTSRSTSVQITSGVADKEIDAHIGIYPNPATSEVTIEWNDLAAHTLELSITDLSGKTLYHSISSGIVSSSALSVDVRNLAGGTYFMHYNFDGTESMRKFVKQ